MLLARTSPAAFLLFWSRLLPDSWGKGLFPLSPSPLFSFLSFPPTSLCPLSLKLLTHPPTPTLAPCPHPSLISTFPCLLPFFHLPPCPSALPPLPPASGTPPTCPSSLSPNLLI